MENHLNCFHRRGRGIGLALARGLSLYLNSTLVDAYFRQFNGHTQVNATDLRSLKYPILPELEALGEAVQGQLLAPRQLTQGQAINKQLTQEQIDYMIDKEFFPMTDALTGDPVAATKHLQEALEALEVLKLLGLPKAQINERSALTLLALLNLTPERQWSQASQPMLGITPMMDFMDQSYGKKYAPNSRETVRRQTVHQFLDAGLIVANPDDPKRPINSGKNVYQIESSALEMLRTYGTPQWDKNLNAYLTSVETLIKRYAQERQMARIPVQIAPGKTITLSPGGQNVLVEQIIHEFASRYTPSAEMIYVGDTDDKFAYFGEIGLTLGPQRQFDAWHRMDLRLTSGKASVARVFGSGDASLVAASGFGQGRVVTSVWEMAAVAALPYNGGQRVYPFIALRDQKPPRQVIRPGTADLLAYCMHVTALKGNARGLSGRIDGCKTGTAQIGGAVNDAWLIGEFRTRAGRKTAFAVWAGTATPEREGAGISYKRAGLGHLIDGLAGQ